METQEGNSKGSQIEMLDRTAVWVCSRGRKAGERTQTHRVSSNTRGTDGAAARRGGRPANERLGQLWANAPGKALGGLNRTRSCDLKLLPATEPPFCQRPTVQLWTLLVSCTWLGVDPLDNAGCVGTGSHITTLFSCIPDITNPPSRNTAASPVDEGTTRKPSELYVSSLSRCSYHPIDTPRL